MGLGPCSRSPCWTKEASGVTPCWVRKSSPQADQGVRIGQEIANMGRPRVQFL